MAYQNLRVYNFLSYLLYISGTVFKENLEKNRKLSHLHITDSQLSCWPTGGQQSADSQLRGAVLHNYQICEYWLMNTVTGNYSLLVK